MVLLSFNITDSSHFLNNKLKIGPEKLMEVVSRNMERLLRCLENYDVYGTFFIAPDLVHKFDNLIKEIYRKGHEIALYHTGNWAETERAQNLISQYIGKSVKGIRVSNHFQTQEIAEHRFSYVSPIETMKLIYLFKRLNSTTAIYNEGNVAIVPESIAPITQMPFNETIFQYVPMKFYENMVFETLKNSEYVLVYLNILQFTDFKHHHISIPFFRRHNTGLKMEEKLDRFLSWINDHDIATSNMKDFVM